MATPQGASEAASRGVAGPPRRREPGAPLGRRGVLLAAAAAVASPVAG